MENQKEGSFYSGITKRMVERIAFILLSLVVIVAIGRQYVPQGSSNISTLDNELQSISFSASAVAVYVGDELELEVNTVPESINVTFSWEILDDGILSLESGVITAVSEGETTVKVTSGAYSAQVRVVAKYKPLPESSTLPPLYYEKLIIANYENTLESDYVPEDLVAIPSSYIMTGYNTMYLTEETLAAYEEMYNDMVAEIGSPAYIISAYRSYARQTELYNSAVASYISQGYTTSQAREKALLTTQTPGNSEHQLGNTLDLSLDGNTDHDFGDTVQGMWIAENAHRYGFIIRYPEDKEDITMIEYEPWHIRYVGVYHATYMYVNGLCLEEYAELQEEAEELANEYAELNPATLD